MFRKNRADVGRLASPYIHGWCHCSHGSMHWLLSSATSSHCKGICSSELQPSNIACCLLPRAKQDPTADFEAVRISYHEHDINGLGLVCSYRVAPLLRSGRAESIPMAPTHMARRQHVFATRSESGNTYGHVVSKSMFDQATAVDNALDRGIRPNASFPLANVMVTLLKAISYHAA